MHSAISSAVTTALQQVGLDVRRRANAPFGVRWTDDLRFFREGRELQTALDVGANAGQTALTLTRSFPTCQIYSFEPVPSTFARLCEQTAPFPNVHPVCCALGDQPGMAKITAEPESERNSFVSNGSHVPEGAPTMEVPIDTVDEFCDRQGLDRLSLLKVDTEGYEIHVLLGSLRRLERGQIEFILAECEFAPRADEPHGSFQQIFHLLAPLGYNVVSFYTGGVDESGWVWGDVLLKQTRHSKQSRPSTSHSRR